MIQLRTDSIVYINKLVLINTRVCIQTDVFQIFIGHLRVKTEIKKLSPIGNLKWKPWVGNRQIELESKPIGPKNRGGQTRNFHLYMRVGHSIVCLCLRVWTVEVVDVQMETRRRQFVEEAKSLPNKPQNTFGAARAKLLCEDFQLWPSLQRSRPRSESKTQKSPAQATDGSVTFYEICAPGLKLSSRT